MKLTFTLFLSIGVSLAQADDLTIPETAVANGLNTLVTALTAADLVDTLSGDGPFTVFAPTDDAFGLLNPGVTECLLDATNEAALEALLTYHVASGKITSNMFSNDQKVQTLEGSEATVTISIDGDMINQAKVTATDVIASNGVVHVIDQVLIPSDNAVVTDLIESCTRIENIPGTAVANKLDTLVTALTAADLVDTLSGDGPFTVFAPTDDAFANVNPGVLGCLLEPDNIQELTDVLLYHVASGKVTSDMLSNDQKVPTLEGNDATVTISGDDVKINDATVTTADVPATNGVVHVIDQVLIPSDNAGITALVDRCASKNIPETAIDNGLNTFVTALTAADLVESASSPGPFTIFVPTDDAFANVNPGVLGCLLESENVLQLIDVLLYHVVDGEVTSDMLSNNQKVETTLEESEVTVTISGDDVKINEATVTTADVFASNGVIHVIDQVLIPSDNADITALIGRCAIPNIPSLAIANKLNTLVTALTAADLVDTLSGDGPFTVFAPTDDAFAMVDQGVLGCLLESDNKQELTDVLLYHVASGKVTSDMLSNDQKVETLEGSDATVTISSDVVKINGATVTTADAIASNGVVHVINQVLLPPDNTGFNALVDRCALKNIPGTAIDNGLNTLVTAVTAAGLVDTLSGDGPFTVFAPTDDAFANVNPGVLGCLLEPDNKQELTDVLLYHVASGKVTSDMLSNDQKVPTLEGNDATVTISGDDVKINEATVTTADVPSTNGVVHVIDQVLIPSDNAGITALVDRCAIPNIPSLAIANKLNTLVTALTAAGLVDTLSGDGPFTVFAPTDDAFAMVDQGVLGCLLESDNKKVLTDVLLYHVASGKVTSDMLSNNQKVQTLEGSDATVTISSGVVEINGATVTTADAIASNGVVHVINQVLLPPDNTGFNALVEKCKYRDIPGTAVANKLDTLVTALGLADLVDALAGTGPFTVFAPTNAAFGKLDEGVLACLLEADHKDALTAVLTYHVASGNVASNTLTNNQKVQTLQGSDITVTVEGSDVLRLQLKVNDATIVAKDVIATNGVVHVIDDVLLPTNNDYVDDLIAECETPTTEDPISSTASSILGVAIPLIGMLATAVAVIV